MQVEILQNGQVLRQYRHNDQVYIEAPPSGDYQIRLTNNFPGRRLVVMSVDGVNVIDGKTAGDQGTGYVLGAWQCATIKGWRRTDTEVASFKFKADGESYAAQTGRGTANTGVIGIAIYEEKPRPSLQWINPVTTRITTTTTTTTKSTQNSNWDDLVLRRLVEESSTLDSGRGTLCSADSGTSAVYASNMSLGEPVEACAAAAPAAAPSEEYSSTRGIPISATSSLGAKSRKSPSKGVSGATKGGGGKIPDGREVLRSATAAAPNLGTGYGEKQYMYTSETEFERSTENPVLVLTFRYGVRAKLIEWGVPLPELHQAPSAFPASEQASVPAPPGWRG